MPILRFDATDPASAQIYEHLYTAWNKGGDGGGSRGLAAITYNIDLMKALGALSTPTTNGRAWFGLNETGHGFSARVLKPGVQEVTLSDAQLASLRRAVEEMAVHRDVVTQMQFPAVIDVLAAASTQAPT